MRYVTSIAKTTLLMAVLTGLFLGVGYLMGGRSGAVLALGLAAVMNFGMYWFSGSLVLKMQGAQPLDTKRFGFIKDMVEELVKADGLPMPALYFVDTPIPNAFATGRSPKHAVVAVTRGITDLLDEAELKAVLGHELGHVKNRDMLVSTIAATMGGAISMLAEMAFWMGGLFGSNDEEGSGNPIGSLAMFIIAPLAAMLIQMAVSRNREFMADDHGAKLVGSGQELASALQKLESFKPRMANLQPSPTQEATAHLMFMNMFHAEGLAGLFSTHPSTTARVERLLKR
jgi:heat shock protein HtpX